MSADLRPDRTGDVPGDVPGALRRTAADLRAAAATLPLHPPSARGAVRTSRPLLAALALVAVVGLLAYGLTAWTGRDLRGAPPAGPEPTAPPDRAVQVLPITPTPTTSPPARATACGTDLPTPVYVPAGYEGPVDGPAPESDEEPRSGQYVAHWSGPDGTVEIRYPKFPGGGDPGTNERITMSGDAGDYDVTVLVDGDSPQCRVMGLRWYGDVPPDYGAAVAGWGEDEQRSLAALVTPPEELDLVRRTGRGTPPEEALPCGGGDVPKNRGDGLDLAPQGDPEAALATLVRQGDATSPLSPSGWTRFDGPGDDVTFGVPFEGGAGWVQVVVVTQGPDGWVVDRWESSGC